MPWIKTKREDQPHQCDLPKPHNEPYSTGEIWECDICGQMYRAMAVGNATVLVKMGKVATMWYRFLQDVMNR